MQFNFDNTYLQLPSELYSFCLPSPVRKPQLIALNHKFANELGIDVAFALPDELATIFSGNKIYDDSAMIAQAYSGHQFGYFNRLGDGRAILLGEQITPEGNRFDLQFKGSGITPYSRRGDGRATLSAMMREYLVSEAMYGLGIPTSRSLAVVATGETVYREQIHQGAVLTRVAASHIRVGTFEHVARFCSTETLKIFTDYVINRHYPEIANTDNPALSLLSRVMEQQIDLIINWMRVGFIHGVMNTDNMTISGETIDYGPCAFMNAFKPETVFSSIDTGGRYAFGNQPQMGLWNLTRLAESLLSIIDKNTNTAIKKAELVLNAFQIIFEDHYSKMLGRKIGIIINDGNDKLLINKLMNWMYMNQADYTNTFVRLMYPDLIEDKIFNQASFQEWVSEWKNRTENSKDLKTTPLQLMQQSNPVYIPRNHQVEEVLKGVTETGQLSTFDAFVHQLSNPYRTTNFDMKYMQTPAQEDEQEYKTYCGT
jgi:uncharacterized protein YdiU (UPF0061 family)